MSFFPLHVLFILLGGWRIASFFLVNAAALAGRLFFFSSVVWTALAANLSPVSIVREDVRRVGEEGWRWMEAERVESGRVGVLGGSADRQNKGGLPRFSAHSGLPAEGQKVVQEAGRLVWRRGWVGDREERGANSGPRHQYGDWRCPKRPFFYLFRSLFSAATASEGRRIAREARSNDGVLPPPPPPPSGSRQRPSVLCAWIGFVVLAFVFRPG